MKHALQRGFTLIELMIVVAIIGILAAIAIPSYQDYITRAQITEAVQLLGGFKTPMAEYCAQQGEFTSTLSDLAGGGTTAGKYVANVASTFTKAAGTLTATMQTAGVNTNISGSTVLLHSADCGSTWTCTSTIAKKYLPSSCKT